MGVDPDRIDVRHYGEHSDLPAHLPVFPVRQAGTAGTFRQVEGRAVLSLEAATIRRPLALVATIAHELGHVLLLGDERISRDRRDGEPLTDLLTVFLGLGVFTANAALEYWSDHEGANLGSYGRWHRTKQGYLTEPMYGYALARFSWLRGETKPPWAAHLDVNPRAYLRKGLKFLATKRP